jgi:hypothetical protein
MYEGVISYVTTFLQIFCENREPVQGLRTHRKDDDLEDLLKLKLSFVYTAFLCNTLYWILFFSLLSPTTCFDLHTRPSSGGYI